MLTTLSNRMPLSSRQRRTSRSIRTALYATVLLLAGCSTDALFLAGGAAAVYYYAKDGVVWRTDSEPIATDQYRITVRKQTYTSGDGQGEMYFRRRAEDVVREEGCVGYQVLSFSSSLQPTTLGTERVFEGTILCRRS